MNNLQIFNNPEFGDIRTVTIDNTIWFVGKDVATALEYKDTSDALKKHIDKEDKLTRQIACSGQRRKMIIINESGLYSLILSSKLPSAKRFKHWVTSEVLPSIRQTGTYADGKIISTLENLTSVVSQLANRVSELESQKISTEHKKPYNPWFDKMRPKYSLLEEHFKITRAQLFKNLLWEMENRYDVDTQQIQSDYCYENALDKCYPLEPFEYIPKYRSMLESIVNESLILNNIATTDDLITSTKHITIFNNEGISKMKHLCEEETQNA